MSDVKEQMMAYEMTADIVHGVLMKVFDVGVLLLGEQGIGKSTLALGLLDRGHALVADDLIQIQMKNQLDNNPALYGSCPSLLQDFLEVRGLSLLNIRKLFGEKAIVLEQRIDMIIYLQRVSQTTLNELDRLQGLHTLKNLLTVDLPQITIQMTFQLGCTIELLVEVAVRQQKLLWSGYSAIVDFTQRQQLQMEQFINSRNRCNDS